MKIRSYPCSILEKDWSIFRIDYHTQVVVKSFGYHQRSLVSYGESRPVYGLGGIVSKQFRQSSKIRIILSLPGIFTITIMIRLMVTST